MIPNVPGVNWEIDGLEGGKAVIEFNNSQSGCRGGEAIKVLIALHSEQRR
jgi:hypothetical protein